MKLDKRDHGSNFRTYCARHTTHRLGEISVDSFQLPSGEYRLNSAEVADTIAQVPDFIYQLLNGYQQGLSDFGINVSRFDNEKLSIGDNSARALRCCKADR
ncbi:MAG: hypothetical protein M3O33_18910 [Cyanobacteriota bacterium]|nr:hypothetical protein [Cyanobacteriota bacterium]